MIIIHKSKWYYPYVIRIHEYTIYPYIIRIYEYTIVNNTIVNNLCNYNVIIRDVDYEIFAKESASFIDVDIEEYQLILDQTHFGKITSLITLDWLGMSK